MISNRKLEDFWLRRHSVSLDFFQFDFNLLGSQFDIKFSLILFINHLEGIVNLDSRLSFKQLLLDNLIFVHFLSANRASELASSLLSKACKLFETLIVKHVCLMAVEHHHLVTGFELKRADRADSSDL